MIHPGAVNPEGPNTFAWGLFDAESPALPEHSGGQDVDLGAKLDSPVQPSRLSGDSSACALQQHQQQQHDKQFVTVVDQSDMAPPPAPLQQQQPAPAPPQQQPWGFESAWAAAQAARHNAPAWAGVAAHPVVGMNGPELAQANRHPSLLSAGGSQGSQQMSWSLTHGLLNTHLSSQKSDVSAQLAQAGGCGMSMSHQPHPLAGQLSGTYPPLHQQQFAAALAEVMPMPQFGGIAMHNSGGASGVGGPLQRSTTLPSSFYAQQSSGAGTPQAGAAPPSSVFRTNSSMGSIAALKQLTEDELRRHVRRQVMTLIQRERDQAQLGWLNELLELTKTSGLTLLGTVRQQLDVLLEPTQLDSAPQTQAAPLVAPQPTQAVLQPVQGGLNAAQLAMQHAMLQPSKVAPQPGQPQPGPALSVFSDGWQAILDQATAGLSARQQQRGAAGGGVPALQPVGGPASCAPSPHAQHPQQQQPQMAGGNGLPMLSTSHGLFSVQPRRQSTGTHSLTSPAGLPTPSSVPLARTQGSGDWAHPSRKRSVGTAGLASAASLTATAPHVPLPNSHVTGAEGGNVKQAKHFKSEPAVGDVGGHHGEARTWRRQNNFMMTIDDIVRRMHTHGHPGPKVPTNLPALDTSAGVDGDCIDFDRVRQVFDKPLKEAADLLSVSVMSLKRTCRKMGVARWPFRKLASLSELAATVRDDELGQQLLGSDKEAVLQYIEAEKLAIVMEPDRPVDQLLSDLRKAKIHMKYEKWGRKSLGSHGLGGHGAAMGGGAHAGEGEGEDDVL